MSEPTEPQRALPDFLLQDPDGVTRADGGAVFADPEEALQRADSRGTGVVGLLPFDPSAPSSLRVPLSWRRGPRPVPARPGTMPRPVRAQGWDSPQYREAVAQVLSAIHDGVVDKAVAARLLTLTYAPEAPADPAAVLDSLLAQHPSAYVFSVRDGAAGRFVMGASPELVVSVQDGVLATHPLAGSAPRVPGADATADMQAGEALVHSAKDRAEHAMVVEDLAARLRPLCEDLDVPAAPSLLATPQLWHLGTRISGRVRPGVTSLDVARAVHPTPAICGVPRDAARELISRTEPEPRGPFGGLVGWNDARGNGRWALNLRSASVSPTRARLFAGAGIVEGSTPEGEHRETGVKLSTFLAALGLGPEDVAALPSGEETSPR